MTTTVPFQLLTSPDLRAADIASAATVNLDAAIGDYVQITGTTTITAITLSENKIVTVRFTGALTLTNGANLVLPGAANITTAAGDMAQFVAISSAIYCIDYQRANAAPPVTPLVFTPPLPGVYRNKVITVTANTTLNVTCDYLWTTDGNGNFKLISAISVTGASIASAGAINQLATGLTAAAATWYYIWGVCKSDGSGVGVVIGTSSSTPPTLPSGYTGGFYAYMGAVTTAPGSAQLMGTLQKGRRAQYIVGLAQTTTARVISSASTGSVSVPTWTAVSISTFVPVTAAVILVYLHVPGANNAMASANNSYGNISSTTNSPIMASGQNTTSSGNMLLESTNIYWASDNANNSINCLGWEEPD